MKQTTAMTTWFQEDDQIRIHSFILDDTAHSFRVFDWAMIPASCVKITEAVVLYHLGSVLLWFSSLVGWAAGFLAAVTLQACCLGRDVSYGVRRTRNYLAADL